MVGCADVRRLTHPTAIETFENVYDFNKLLTPPDPRDAPVGRRASRRALKEFENEYARGASEKS
jgi:hypothetical protein